MVYKIAGGVIAAAVLGYVIGYAVANKKAKKLQAELDAVQKQIDSNLAGEAGEPNSDSSGGGINNEASQMQQKKYSY